MATVCAPGAHVWVGDGRFYSWLVCRTCGAPAVCKACHGRGVDIPAFPDVFCLRHAPYADDLRTRVLSGPLLGERLISLAQTVQGYGDGWVPCEDGRRVRVVVGDLEVWLHRALRGEWWRVVLLAAGRLVYHAEGVMPLVVRSLSPGRWVAEVQAADTWVHGEVQS